MLQVSLSFGAQEFGAQVFGAQAFGAFFRYMARGKEGTFPYSQRILVPRLSVSQL